jgi:hypothetical protein
MIIVGLMGGIGHGKSTFAAVLASAAESSHAFESSDIISEVANKLRASSASNAIPQTLDQVNQWLRPLPDVLQAVVHQQPSFSLIEVTETDIKHDPASYVKLFEYLELIKAKPELASVMITAENKSDVRPLLQWLGGYLLKKIDDKVWYMEIVNRISYLPPVELVTVGGVRYPGDAECLRAVGGRILDIYRPSQPGVDAQDITERERTAITPDATVTNDGSLDNLHSCAKVVLEDLRANRLQGLYTALDYAI